MSVFDLQKRQEAIKFVLEKRAVARPPVLRVGAAFDVSGSAEHLFKSGIMQETVNRLLPVAMRFDDNGEMDVWSFDTGFDQLATVSKMDYEDYIKREVLGNNEISKWGGTNYGGVMNAMSEFYFPQVGKAAKAPASSGFMSKLFGKPAPAAAPSPASSSALVPAMALFITDGANNDRAKAREVLASSVDVPVYWQLIGVGNPREFTFLEEMADELPHVGFVHLSSLSLSDEQLYDKLLSDELCAWMKKF